MMSNIRLVIFFFMVSFALHFSSQKPINLYRTNQQLDSNITSLINSHTQINLVEYGRETSFKHVQFGNFSSKLKAIITCNIHAHQLITGELCVDFINHIVTENSSLLNKMEFRVFYLSNRMRENVIKGDYCLRTDENKIDPNRNFPSGFILNDENLETYGGKQPLIVPYSQCLDQLARQIRPISYLDIHSGQFSLVYSHEDEDQEKQPSLTILMEIKKNYCHNCRIRNVNSHKLGGQAYQYLKTTYHTKYSNLFQIYGAYNSNQQRNDLCLTVFNPRTENQLNYYRQKWVTILKEYYRMIIQTQQGQN